MILTGSATQLRIALPIRSLQYQGGPLRGPHRSGRYVDRSGSRPVGMLFRRRKVCGLIRLRWDGDLREPLSSSPILAGLHLG
jgi:hypothetical protein